MAEEKVKENMDTTGDLEKVVEKVIGEEKVCMDSKGTRDMMDTRRTKGEMEAPGL